MTRSRSPSLSVFADQRGVIFVEFLIAFVPLWAFFLCIVQLAFVARADLMVRHAADSAARSAVVVLPDDPNEYGGEPEMSVGRNPVTESDIGRALDRVGSALRSEPTASSVAAVFFDETVANLGRSRLNTIRLAAHVPLMPLAPTNVGGDSRPSIAKAIGDERKLVSALYYQPFALAVTFPGQQGEVVTGSEITVRVTYSYQCTVPLARRILCQAFRDLAGGDEFEEAFFPPAQTIVGGRFRSLQHDTTLMIHDAPYEYQVRG